ncbi:DNA-(apurinic or apyrimidinic site) lyase 2 [Colletotrichum chlorophyti]|uniref:DNA-(apurinic or apyrimidinic site) endonuclease 2 n=1 Tax=Colletotrichum chlorophyti TaxID=708187 RepID=A0A1Q8RPN1_9PEZI|nr:DNA-(apurinic or apyrimidinic site) lyase 2 [Colletotrichum chlorophyti]
MFDILEADIVVMQETKIQRKDLSDDMVLVPGWDVFFSLPKHKKGYSGVAIYTRNATCCPIRAEEGITGILTPPNSSTSFRDLPQDQQIGGYPRPGQGPADDIDEVTLDSEGRCVILEFPAFVLIGTYSPATRDSSRDGFRLGYLAALDARVRNLVAAGKQVILTGDLNVNRGEIDSCNVREALRKEGMSVEDWMAMPSRRLFNQLVLDGEVAGERDEGREEPVLCDLTRMFHPTRQGMFTCWDTKRNTRPANNGSRIDYVLCSVGIKDWFTDSNIQEGLMGSDHCPVYATLGDTVSADGKEMSILDLMNPSDMFRDGKRLREWSAKDLLPLSAKLIPEFDRRRSIRDMFMKKPTLKPAPSSASEEPIALEDNGPVLPQQSVSESISQVSVQSNNANPPPSTTTTKPTSSQTKSPTKRPVDSLSPAKRPQKKSKPNESDASKSNGGLAQSTLMGFFKPKQTAQKPAPPTPSTADSKASNAIQSPPTKQINSALARSVSGLSETDAEPLRSAKQPPSPSPSAAASVTDASERVFDPIEVKESWSKFSLGKRVVPKCEHGEPCISLKSKKPGMNCGRSFYICPRPLGKSGEKEKGTEWRCATFIWSSDWKKDQS